MKEHGRTFQCEPCRQIIIFFAVSDGSAYVAAGALPKKQSCATVGSLTAPITMTT
jgi:hypothetical protein